MALPTRAHAWIVRRSGGRLGRRFLGAPVIVLRTTGRRSGEQRDAPIFYVSHGDCWAVVASNAASERHPAWYLNLEAKPEADVFVEGGWHAVRARRAAEAEVEELWPRFVEVYRGYDHYRTLATREFPVMVLERR
jgi:deazaflavin-dependent oxidoreductase (nitroreductase family)